jgi:hypothetical protein
MKKSTHPDYTEVPQVTYQVTHKAPIKLGSVIESLLSEFGMCRDYPLPSALAIHPSQIFVYLEYQDQHTQEKWLVAHNRYSGGGTSPELTFAPGQNYYIEIPHKDIRVRVFMQEKISEDTPRESASENSESG